MKKYRNYTDEDIINYSKNVNNISQLLKKLNLKSVGGNFANIKRNLQRLNIDTSHWTGSAWNKDQQLKDWKNYSRAVNLKKHLIQFKGHCCENCKNQKWMGELIPLEIEHIDGDRTNNEISNLKLLCCNCHAQTPTWRRRKSSPPQIRTENHFVLSEAALPISVTGH